MKTLLLSRDDVEHSICLSEVIDAVESAYRIFQNDGVIQPPIQAMNLPKTAAESDVKSCYNDESGYFSIKTVGLFPGNAKGLGAYRSETGANLPNMMGNIILGDGQTGAALAIMDASLITGIRTGAAGALSAKYLARSDADTVAVFAAGAQARMQILALAQVRKLRQIRVFDRFAPPEVLSAYKRDMAAATGATVQICQSVEEAAHDADILICVTPSREFYLKEAYVKAGAHIIEIGVDDIGKNELEPSLFSRADKVICDSIPQCLARGETRNAVQAGVFTEAQIYGEIGELILGRKNGREQEDEITIFDSTGMAIQDNETAALCYQSAVRKGIGSWFAFI